MARGLFGLMLAGGLAVSAAAAEAPGFPKALDGEPLLSWLKSETDILPSQVVAISPSAVSAVVSTYPESYGSRVVVRAEALTPEAQAREGVLSWHVSVNADCARRKVKLGETTGYPERNLLGGGRAIRAAEADWRTPQPRTALDNVWRVACDKTFRRPFQEDAPAKAAEAARPPASPAEPKPAAPKAAPPKPQPKPEPKPAAPAAVAPKPAPPARPRAGRSGAVVQISASDSEAAAHADIARIFEKLGGRGTRVEKATVKGRVVYRAVITGFDSTSEAARFCETLKAGGQNCFARGK
jgi:hypothetical protein